MSETNKTENRLIRYVEAHSLKTGIPTSTLLQDQAFVATCKSIIEQLPTT